jgi:Methyltransferase domain
MQPIKRQGGSMSIVSRVKAAMHRAAQRLLRRALRDPEIREAIFQAVARPADSDDNYTPPNIRRRLWLRANDDTVAYVEQHMLYIPSCAGRWRVIDTALEAVTLDGEYLEFGVADGASINYIADKVGDRVVHGFDSFEGLPDDWFDGVGRGLFDRGGALPDVRANVRLHRGTFDVTLPPYVAQSDGKPVAFVHVDCDLYASTREVFQQLGDRITSGTIIVFDEYFNFPGWRNQEYKAFQEFVRDRDLKYAYLTYDRNQSTVAAKIL